MSATNSIASADAAAPPAAVARASFFRARLASFFGVAPLGVWTLVHLWHNLSAFQGGDEWQSAVTEYPHPFAQLLTAVLVLLPLVLHAAWGIGRMFTSRPNNVRYGFYANLKYLLQRLSAIGVLLFLGAHIWRALISPRLIEGHAESFAGMTQEMHFNTPTLIVYVLGTLGIAYHLANGAQTFMMSWGIVATQRGLRRLEGYTIGLFALLLLMSWGAVYALWAAGAAP